MSYSANEIMSLASRAARGAGAPAAQAAHFGAALVRHLAMGRDEDVVLDALDALPEGPILTLPIVVSDDGSLALSYRERGMPEARLYPSRKLYNTLLALAHLTYVPATEANRLSGAGAGLTDND